MLSELGETTAKKRCQFRCLALELASIPEGGTVAITRLYRLACAAINLHQNIGKVTAKGRAFIVLQQSGADTPTSTGKPNLAVLAALAEFEAGTCAGRPKGRNRSS